MSKKLLIGVVLVSLIFGILTYINVNATTTTSTIPTSGPDLACVQTAVERRDSAVISAWNTLTTSISSVLTTRKDAVKAAWGIADKRQRREAIKTAWTNFRNATKNARNTFRASRKSAWDQFKTDAKACRAGNLASESIGSEVNF